MTGARPLVLAGDIDRERARAILALHQGSGLPVLYRRTGHVRGQRTPEVNRFLPLAFAESHAVRVEFYQAAMTWSWQAARRWAARRDRLTLACLRVGDLRLTYDQFLLENLHLTAAYLARCVDSEQIDRILVVEPVPVSVRAAADLLARVRGLRVEYRQVAGAPAADAEAALAGSGVRKALLRDLSRWVGSRPEIAPGGVIFEAGSIQSARNVENLVRELIDRGVEASLLGLPRFGWSGQRRRFYEIDWIARTAADEGIPPITAINLLGFTPRWAVAAAPVILLLQRGQRRLLGCFGPSVQLFGTRVRLASLARGLMAQFDLDLLIAVLCRHAARRISAATRPRAVIITNPVTLTGRSCLLIRSEVTKIVTVQDGTISNEIVRRPAGRYDVACVWGEAFADTMVRVFGHERHRVLVSGPQRDVFPAQSPGTRPLAGDPAAAQTILLAHQPSTFGSPTSDFLLEWLAQEADLAGWRVLVRPHPRADVPALAAQIAGLASGSLSLTKREPFRAELSRSRVLVAEFSTTVFEAWAHGHPCLVADIEARADMALLHGVLGAACVTSRDQLRRRLHSLMADPAVRDNLVRQQNALLERYFARVRADVAAATVVNAALGGSFEVGGDSYGS